ncbi:hypothetical protein RYF71_04860 [Wolbachia endosymbiont of Drosophila malagassya]|uniref:hypothetical protein n=1 Tax=Wolbachia TaxID=953 RepID=UPI0005127759|nr:MULTISPECIES: hypothetical protein [Wolbachia]MDU8941331.1 hypothetical protein [Wolbachia endosymbiont of Drosophila malagassya]CDR79615.1 hypothetical protein WPAU_1264 [Wolbachia endosymbiont of Drosophila simulans wAu]AOV87872.1 hypothetical protein WG67_05615 [Wolbachia endosymbiont of Drosophila incompta]MBA8754455.1 hypothetical protein [Wolbachia pipientis]MBA8766212.1 hypothetical protein [Wolbachia pipientis]
MESSNSMFFDTDYPELRKAISDIIESIAQSSQEGKKELFTTLSEQVKGMNLKDLGLAINDQGLQKEVNKELFIKFIEEALEGLTSENVDSKIIEEALKSVNQQAISNVINNNKGPLDNLVNYFKSASANKKIGIASAVMVLGAAFSPLIVLATLIALVGIGARYAGIGIVKAGEKIKEGAIDAGKAVKSLSKNLGDKLPEVGPKKDNFSKLYNSLAQEIIGYNMSEEGEKIKNAQSKAKVIGMLQNEGQRSAIQELVKNGTIQNFSEDDMKKLREKGTSTYESDKEALEELMEKFQSKIMAIGEGKIEEVEKMVNDKVNQMKSPVPQLDSPSSEQASTGETKTL